MKIAVAGMGYVGLSNAHILFSPEFLREGKALYDNQYPSHIIVDADRPDDIAAAMKRIKEKKLM